MDVKNYNIDPSLCFDDILISPLYSKIKSRKDINLSINLGTNGRNLLLKTPVISSPMDTVSMSNMCIKMALYGGIGILHRYQSIESQVSELQKVKRYLQYIITKPYTLKLKNTIDYVKELIKEHKVLTFCVVDDTNHLLGILTNRDMEYIINTNGNTILVENIMNPLNKLHIIKISTELFTILIDDKNNIEFINIISNAKKMMIQTKVEKIPIVDIETNILLGLITWKNVKHFEDNQSQSCLDNKGKLCCGAAIGITDDWNQRLESLIEEGADCICIDVASGHNENLGIVLEQIRSKYHNLILIAGNICTGEGYKYLADKDIDCIRVGIGNGSICSTRKETGIGRGQFTSIMEVCDYKIKFKLHSHIISDGGSLNSTGNKAKAIIAGASAIMLGRTLAATEESPSMIIYKDGQKYKYTRGMASTSANMSKNELCGYKKDKCNSNEDIIKKHSEGIDGYTHLCGSVKDVIDDIVSGVKSSFSYIGCENIYQVHQLRYDGKILFNLITSLGMNETNTRLVKF